MQLTLRKAHQIRSLIEARQSTIGYPRPSHVSVYSEEIDKKISLLIDSLAAETVQAVELERILRELRGRIDRANADSGINDILNEQGSLNRKLERVVKVVTSAPVRREDVRVEITRILNIDPKERRYEGDTVLISGLTPEMHELAKQEELDIRRRLRVLSDELLAKNFQTQVTMADSDYKKLEEYAIV